MNYIPIKTTCDKSLHYAVNGFNFWSDSRIKVKGTNRAIVQYSTTCHRPCPDIQRVKVKKKKSYEHDIHTESLYAHQEFSIFRLTHYLHPLV